MNNLEEFKQSLSLNQSPAGLNVYLESLWYDGKGNWDKSHEVIQDVPDKTASWIHAYLHRKEGDIWNADYWYNKAGRSRPAVSLDNEWQALVEYCLGI